MNYTQKVIQGSPNFLVCVINQYQICISHLMLLQHKLYNFLRMIVFYMYTFCGWGISTLITPSCIFYDKIILIYLHFRFIYIHLSVDYQMHSVTFPFHQIFTILLVIGCLMKLTMSLYGRVKWSKNLKIDH